MSAAIAVNDLIQITYSGQMFGQTILTVLHARCTVAPSSGSSAEVQLQDLVDTRLSVRTATPFLDKYILAATSDFVLLAVKAQKVKPSRTIYAQAAIVLEGENANAGVAANVAASIEKQSTHVGRTGVGRMQFGALPNTAIAGGAIDPGYSHDFLKPIADNMFGTFSGGTVTHGTFAFCLPAGGADPTYDLYNCIPKPNVRTMHRRTVGLGI